MIDERKGRALDSHVRSNRGCESQHPVTQWWNCGIEGRTHRHPEAGSIAQFRFYWRRSAGLDLSCLSSPVVADQSTRSRRRNSGEIGSLSKDGKR